MLSIVWCDLQLFKGTAYVQIVSRIYRSAYRLQIKKIFTIALLVFGFRSLAQVPIPMDKSLLEERKDVLQRIRGESGRFSLTALEKERLSQQHGFPLTLFLDQGKTAEFQFIDEAG